MNTHTDRAGSPNPNGGDNHNSGPRRALRRLWTGSGQALSSPMAYSRGSSAPALLQGIAFLAGVLSAKLPKPSKFTILSHDKDLNLTLVLD